MNSILKQLERGSVKTLRRLETIAKFQREASTELDRLAAVSRAIEDSRILTQALADANTSVVEDQDVEDQSE